MSAETDMPMLSPVRGRELWSVVQPHRRVPAGFTFDGASVPRFFHRVVTPHDPRVIRAAMEHDHAYRTGYLPRVDADERFRRALVEDGVRPWLARLMFWAVRAGGGRAYGGRAE